MEKAFSGTFTLDDFLDQVTAVERMGGLKDLVSMLPGAGGLAEEMEKAGVNEKFLARKKAVVLSMTPEERADPDLLDGSRRRRVARGSGVPVQDVNRLLKEFRDARDMMKRLGSAQGGALGRLLGRGRDKRKKDQFRRLRERGWTLRPAWCSRRITTACRRFFQAGRSTVSCSAAERATRRASWRRRSRLPSGCATPATIAWRCCSWRARSEAATAPA